MKYDKYITFSVKYLTQFGINVIETIYNNRTGDLRMATFFLHYSWVHLWASKTKPTSNWEVTKAETTLRLGEPGTRTACAKPVWRSREPPINR